MKVITETSVVCSKLDIYQFHYYHKCRHGHDRMVVGFTTTCTISTYHQVSVFSYGYSVFLHQWKWPPRYDWNIVERGIKHHKCKPNHYYHWIDTSSGGLLVPDSIIHPVVSVLILTSFIGYIFMLEICSSSILQFIIALQRK